ncbi:polysaccharide pyruvyl transferase family protein [Eubacterium sp.]
MKIGMMGFDFESPNKGCEALTYSFVNMLIECYGNDLKIVNFSYGGFGMFPEKYPEIDFLIRRPKIKNPIDWIKIKKEMAGLDIIFDVTFGDGFSDIYGKMWNFTTNMLKQLAIKSKKPLILLPQTYGPYKNFLLKKWAEQLVKNSYAAYSRDTASAREMNLKCKDKIRVITDMAFGLPYNKTMYSIDKTRVNVGINVSALLWDSAYAKDNRFGLNVDYYTYITSLIEKLLETDKYVVHLIPHVIAKNHYNSAENDLRPCKEVKNRFSDNDKVICAPAFKTPIEAKSYIANMNIFIGARMHATIGAVSAGVATIPFAYSKKFKTMFGNLGYKYVIEARDVDTDTALKQTEDWIINYDELEKVSLKAREKTKDKLNLLKRDISVLVKE